MNMQETSIAQRKPYDTDLSDEQWATIEPLIARQERRGRGRQVAMRDVVNGMLYQTRTGCQWRLLPHEFPHWSVVRYYFDRWKHDGTFQRLNDRLREAARQQAKRDPVPSAAILDSQSVKTTEAGGLRGFDGGKKGQRSQTAPVGGYPRLPARYPCP